eukprot:scaffold2880_cov173-Amphora_coffeaeformis.AAC.6
MKTGNHNQQSPSRACTGDSREYVSSCVSSTLVVWVENPSKHGTRIVSGGRNDRCDVNSRVVGYHST